MQIVPGSTSSCASVQMDALDGIFIELFKISADKIEDSMTMNDVALWDSLRHMELITAIEQKFPFELTFEEISTMQSIGAIRKLVAEKMQA